MGLPAGRTNNKKGRPKGTKNQSIEELRDLIAEFLADNLPDLQRKYESLDSAKDQLYFLERLLQYSLPKLQAQSLKVENEVQFMNLPDWMKE